MLKSELIKTCSMAPVADAVSRSLGCDFHARLGSVAENRGAMPGQYAAILVKRFAHEASNRDWSRLGAVMNNADMPLLSGFRFLIEEMIDRDAIRGACFARDEVAGTSVAAA